MTIPAKMIGVKFEISFPSAEPRRSQQRNWNLLTSSALLDTDKSLIITWSLFFTVCSVQLISDAICWFVIFPLDEMSLAPYSIWTQDYPGYVRYHQVKDPRLATVPDEYFEPEILGEL